MLAVLVIYEHGDVKVTSRPAIEDIIDVWKHSSRDRQIVPRDKWLAFDHLSRLWIAVDNSRNKCLVEEFSNKETAFAWLDDEAPKKDVNMQENLGRSRAERSMRITADTKFQEMVLFAVRYALGRRTYAVEDTVEYVMSVLDRLDKRYIDFMIDEIDGRKDLGYGTDLEKAEWMRPLAALENESEEREENYGY